MNTASLPKPLACSIAVLLLAATVLAQPERIILLRHAEKPVDEADIHLSERGRQRAAALADWATNSPAWKTNNRPAAIFACKPNAKAPSVRAIETITPLAARLSLSVQTPFFPKNFAPLARQILDDPALSGKTVVLCWTRDELPQLAESFGVAPGSVVCKSKTFDRLWVVTFRDKRAVATRLPQKLLPGDSIR